MGLSHSPRIVTDGLVLCLDAGNPNKSAKGFKSLTGLSDWTLGSGGTATYSRNGTVAENQRILDTGPYGTSTVVWDGPVTDATSDDESGFWGPSINIDPTKLYRFSIWMRRKVIGDGSSYLGCHAWDASTTQHVLNRSNGTTNQNPYFLASVWWGNANDWYLVTGHIWPAGSGTGSAKTDSGIYNTSGTKISGTTDFVWQTTNTYTYVRSFLYYSTVTTTNQQLYYPRIDVCDGTEPTIAELIAGVGSKIYDISGNGNNGNILNSAALYNSAGYINFDGVDDYIDLLSTATLPTGTSDRTIIACVRTPTSFPSSYHHVIHWGTATTDQSFGLAVLSNGALNSHTWAAAPSQGTVTTNTNYCLAVSYTNTSALHKFWINGISQGAGISRAINTGITNARVGSRISTPTEFWGPNGRIYNIQVYNRALSDSEIQQNFNALRGRFGI